MKGTARSGRIGKSLSGPPPCLSPSVPVAARHIGNTHAELSCPVAGLVGRKRPNAPFQLVGHHRGFLLNKGLRWYLERCVTAPEKLDQLACKPGSVRTLARA